MHAVGPDYCLVTLRNRDPWLIYWIHYVAIYVKYMLNQRGLQYSEPSELTALFVFNDWHFKKGLVWLFSITFKKISYIISSLYQLISGCGENYANISIWLHDTLTIRQFGGSNTKKTSLLGVTCATFIWRRETDGLGWWYLQCSVSVFYNNVIANCSMFLSL